ncbi:MAG: WD40 repeat domain-containing protein [Microcoleaceae cyanobacterium]
MTIPSYFYPLAAPFLIPVARHLGQQLMHLIKNPQSSTQSETDLPAFTQKIYNDPRYIEAIIEYSYRQSKRELEYQAISPNQIEHHLKIQQQEQRDRLEISRLQRELIRDLQRQQVQSKLQEIDELWNREKWFSNLSRQETERILTRRIQQHRLLMLVAPPDISSDCPEPFKQHLKKDVANGLRRFLSQYYPESDDLRSVEFYADYFNRPLGDIEVYKLQAVLAPVPTLILYGDINDYEINIQIGFWGLDSASVSLIPIQPWNWEAAVRQLELQGQSSAQAIRQVRQFIVQLYQILAAFLVDWYYLSIDYNYSPQLFQLRDIFSQDLIKDYIDVIQSIQKRQKKIHDNKIKEIVKDLPSRPPETVNSNIENWQYFKTIQTDQEQIYSLAISPDNQFLISGGVESSVQLYALKTGGHEGTLDGHVNSVTALTVSPDGKWIISGSLDKTIKIWSADSQVLQQTLLGSTDFVNTIAVSSDSEILVSGSGDNLIRIWSIQTGDLLRTLVGHTNMIDRVKISSDSQWLVSTSIDDRVKIWSIETGKVKQNFIQPKKKIKSVLISPDAQYILYCGWDNTIQVWSVEDSSLKSTIPANTQENVMAISPGCRWIASMSPDYKIRIRCLETGRLLKSFIGHQSEITQMVFSADSQFLISGSCDGEIKVWCSSEIAQSDLN